MLDAKPMFAGAAKARLHFVRNKHAAVFFHRVEDDFEILGGGVINPPTP